MGQQNGEGAVESAKTWGQNKWTVPSAKWRTTGQEFVRCQVSGAEMGRRAKKVMRPRVRMGSIRCPGRQQEQGIQGTQEPPRTKNSGRYLTRALLAKVGTEPRQLVALGCFRGDGQCGEGATCCFTAATCMDAAGNQFAPAFLQKLRCR